MFRSSLGLGVAFLAMAVGVALLGYWVLSAESWVVARVFVFVFLALAVLSFVGGLVGRARGPDPDPPQ